MTTEAEVLPTHAVAFAGDKRTLCNRKTRDHPRVVLAKFVRDHERGHPESFKLCDECADVARDHNIALDH